MKVKTQLELAQQWEALVHDLAQTQVEPKDIEKLIGLYEEIRPDLAGPKVRDDIRRAVSEAIKRRDGPKAQVPPGSGKSSL